eukprot:Skav213307  [mRNA]  locus=scaffold1383:6630:8392:+ [translate_table: standard]
MKRGCKAKLADWLKSTMGLEIDQDALIDIQTLAGAADGDRLRWNRMDPAPLQKPEHPIYDPRMSLSSMDAGAVDLGLACEDAPGRFLGVASGDIRDPVRCVSGIKHYVQKHGFVAVRILPWLWERYADDRL